MTRALERVLFDRDESEVVRVPLHPTMHFASSYPLRRPNYPRSEKRSLLAGLPEVRGIARPQRWHPILDMAASSPALRASAREAVTLTELRADILRCISVALDALPSDGSDASTQGRCAILSAAGILEIHISASLRAVRDQLLTAAQSGQPVDASKYFKAMLAVEEGSSEFMGSELAALRNIEDMQLTGLIWGDSGAPPRAARSRNRGKNQRKNAGSSSSQASSSEITTGPRNQQQGRSKGQSPQRNGGTGPQK